MQRLDSVLRWAGAVGITLAPLCVFVIPQLMYPGMFETPEEQFRAIAEGSTGGYAGQVMQISGAVFLMAAALGLGGITIGRRRGRTLGAIGLIIGMLAAISLLVVLGYETAVAFILISSTVGTESGVALAVELYNSPTFLVPLLVGLIGFILTLLILSLALWRSGVVPIVVPLLFVLAQLVNFLPLPAIAMSVLPGLLLLVPCLWMTVQVIRGMPRGVPSLTTDTAPLAEQRGVLDS